VFAPETNEVHQDHRKRRKLVHAKSNARLRATTFVPLMRGIEDDNATLIRREIFENIWQQQEEILNVQDLIALCRSLQTNSSQKILEHAYATTIKSLEDFIDSAYEER